MGKRCSRCSRVRPRDDFHRMAKARDGLQSYCKDCSSARDRSRERRWADRPNDREWYYRNTYGIGVEDVERMKAAEQGGVCAVCAREPGRWVVDHDHETGQVRGMLCDLCNRALGLLHDDPDILTAAVAYLLTSQRGVSRCG